MNLLHIRHQGRSLAALTGIALSGLRARPTEPPATPGPVFAATVPALPQGLRDDFVRWCGGDPERWRGQVPPWLFPQWGLPLLARTLADIPWPPARVVNQGCRLQLRGPVPAGVPLQATAQLVGIEVTERRARMHQRLVTGTPEQPELLVADVFAVVPLARGGGGKREPPTAPDGAEVASPLRAERGDGWQFALLTGDFNPIHWLGPYAGAAGFGGVILHGFGTMARVGEALVTGWLGGDSGGLAELDVRFVRPLRLPSEVALLAGPEQDGRRELAVGEPGGSVCMLGTARRRGGPNGEPG